MSSEKIQNLEKEIYELTVQLAKLRTDVQPEAMNEYVFESVNGPVKLADAFGSKDRLLVIHNMGQGCRYCTLWADGINAFLPHLETAMSVIMVSKDDLETQRTFANERGWRFNMLSHRNNSYAKDHSTYEGGENNPGATSFIKKDGQVFKLNSTAFGPYDQYCALWNLLSLAGIPGDSWTPQYNYWKRPAQLDDGGNNVN